MKANMEQARLSTELSESNAFVGWFVRRQGLYGTVAVTGRVNGVGVDLLSDSKRLFPRDGMVETHGLSQHKGLIPGDWVKFNVARNTRPGAPMSKIVHLCRLPRYAVLPEGSLSSYRTTLTNEGWSAERRAGLWALRISEDRVLVVELEAGKDGALRIPRTAARNVCWWRYHASDVIPLRNDGRTENVFMADPNRPDGSFDWSDEADHVARVIRALADASDPLVADIITWLDLHYEGRTGRVVVATEDHQAAEAALRSGELAERLRADRFLMQAYLSAALQDDAVREAVAIYSHEGHTEERVRLREILQRELAEERTRAVEGLAVDMAARRTKAEEQLEREMFQIEEAQRKDFDNRLAEVNRILAARIEELEQSFNGRQADLQLRIDSAEATLAETKTAIQDAGNELAAVHASIEAEYAQMRDTTVEIGRLLAIKDRLGAPELATAATMSAAFAPGIERIFPEHVTVDARSTGKLIAEHSLLTDAGKDQLFRLVVLLLAGELPIIFGRDAADLLRLAEMVLGPGRFVSIEADPTLISIDDLWARPGSGAPTLMASASAAAGSGSILVVIRGIERSGARFWMPALSEALRGGGLPRGLLVCGVAGNRDHDEIAALPQGWPIVEAKNALIKGAFLAAPHFFSHSKLNLHALDPGPVPIDLSVAGPLLLELGFEPNLDQAMRVARMFTEAQNLTGDDVTAKRLVIALAQSMSRLVG